MRPDPTYTFSSPSGPICPFGPAQRYAIDFTRPMHVEGVLDSGTMNRLGQRNWHDCPTPCSLV